MLLACSLFGWIISVSSSVGSPTRDTEVVEFELHGADVDTVDMGELRDTTVAVRTSPLSAVRVVSSNEMGTERRV